MASSTLDDASSSSSSSDDDFLMDSTTGGGSSSTDRDALVRKKLLESFYGKAAVADATAGQKEDVAGDSEDEDHPAGGVESSGGSKTDWDAPSFDAAAHTVTHVLESSVHDMLETEERLALQVRTLDSTMQTLVYENYSRFIDATDAIRSVNVNVQANWSGIQRLVAGMQLLDHTSRGTEAAVADLRDQVAEKIRVKRLLTRLDALLKLPSTLKEQIATGNYRTAYCAYKSAATILRKHSEGFESLRSITEECNSILADMKVDLNNKLLHWSGTHLSSDSMESSSDPKVPDPVSSTREVGRLCTVCSRLMDDLTLLSFCSQRP